MWLINTRTMKLEEFSDVKPPPYAILSHTWENEEVSFQEMSGGPSAAVKAKKGYAKIQQTCCIAISEMLDYAWIDTCCIDKSSSAELTEAINSMFQFYEQSTICYAYLCDLDPHISDEEGFPKCRWFTRGWTLQELIAPSQLVFYNSGWGVRGTKQSATYLISQITRIQSDYLWNGQSVKFASVAERMSWASRRETTRIEDMAYCLLGLFDINMPMLYGEGSKAFLRLQEEIVKKTNDLSLLSWKPSSWNDSCCGVFADSPSVFESCNTFRHGTRENEFSVTNKGIRVTTQLLTRLTHDIPPHFLLYLGYDADFQSVHLVLQKWGPDQFVRDKSINGGIWISPTSSDAQLLGMQTIYLTHTPGFEITQDTMKQKRQRAVRLELKDDLKVFDVIPQSVWDPVHSMLLDPAVSVVLLLGFPSSPYGSIEVLSLSGRTKEKVYVLPAESPAIPFILKNLSTLAEAELERYWNLSPVRFARPRDLPPGLGEILTGQSSVGENMTVNLTATFNEVHVSSAGELHGPKDLQLNRLTIGIMACSNPPPNVQNAHPFSLSFRSRSSQTW